MRRCEIQDVTLWPSDIYSNEQSGGEDGEVGEDVAASGGRISLHEVKLES